jgi:NAD(P)-dependent dehydrogenase (short-subunit alcohol dehydrogenase family)
LFPLSIGIAIGVAATSLWACHCHKSCSSEDGTCHYKNIGFSIADQPKRFLKAKTEKNQRVLNIDSVYDPSHVQGKTVLVTGGNRGIGRAIANEMVKQGARVIITTRTPMSIPNMQVISGIEVTDNEAGNKLAEALKGTTIDLLVNNAGYFFERLETIQDLNFEEEMKMIDICALGPLRITSGLFNAGLLAKGAKIAVISSQGGSIAWRKVQNPRGHDYGHHMSKAAENMMGMLLSQELKEHGIVVTMLHPGFNKTDMTKKYEKSWEEEGAVDTPVGAKRVIHEIGQMTMDRTGLFINCEDGLQIPW